MRNQIKKEAKKHFRISSILMLFTFIGLIVVGGRIIIETLPYIEGEKYYKKLSESYVKGQPNNKKIDFDALKIINSDIVGWLIFDEPKNINYPIVKSKDNKEYLTKTFQGTYDKYGSIFMDKDNNERFSDENTIIYGHNLGFGIGMFSELPTYQNSDFRKKYPYFYIYTISGEVKKYKIFFANYVKNTDKNYQNRFVNLDDYSNYLAFLNSQLNEEQLTAESKIVSLSTCAKPDVIDDKRFLVQAILVG
ncbi:SrtB family sortase [Enterococcus pernyi]|uniref:SrtB family sortase n=1 Tax=Enterococcus mundtii TaxID=53346 RepID=A0A1V2UCY2_ENTMU|nr:MULTISPECIES: class B sortase [Enterococcus]ONN41148.1 hypothetical protein BTN92_13850 [Enterococcus mundtii]